MTIKVAQIDQAGLLSFVLGAGSGAFSGDLSAYLAQGGTLGPYVLYTGGLDQTVGNTVSFLNSPVVAFSGVTGSAAQRGWTLQQITGGMQNLSGVLTGQLVNVFGDQFVLGRKTFTGAVTVGTGINPFDAVQKQYVDYLSGLLQTGINNVTVSNAVLLTTDQLISGVKSFVSSPQVPTPTASGDAVNKSYVDNINVAGAVYTTGDQTISGTKTFLNSPTIPLATQASQPVTLAQLNAIGNVMAPITGFAGVLDINGSSGASGHVFLQAAGTVSIIQCASVFYISGNTAGQTNIYSAAIPLASGATGFAVVYSSPLPTKPVIGTSIETTGSNVSVLSATIYGSNPTGFNVKLSSATPDPYYFFNFNSIPATGASGFSALMGQQGTQGPFLNNRGIWQVGQTYGVLDYVYQPLYNASYSSNSTAISTALNGPAGTGNGQWSLLMTGIQGATGSWVWKGAFGTGIVYQSTYAATYNGSSYGYTGTNAISGVFPDALTGGWGLIASKGDVGYQIISGIVTGNYVNLSFFMDPVVTGLNLAEAFVSRSFNLTGFALGCVTSGFGFNSGAGPMSGSFYVRDLANTKVTIQSFTFSPGVYSYVSGGIAIPITGMSRIGVDLTQSLSGIAKLSFGAFGFGV